MSVTPFELERSRLEVARRLPAHCFDEFQRLSRSLIHGPAFQWVLVDAPHDGLRKQVTAALNEVLSLAGLRVNRLPLTQRVVDVATLEARLVKNAGQADVVHVGVARGWFTEARWDAFNARRERLAAQARARLVFWLDEPAIALASQAAPDLWAWRGGVYRFVPEGTFQWPAQRSTQAGDAAAQPHAFRRWEILDSATMAERHRRIVEIRQWLAAHPDAPDELKMAPMDELGVLLYRLGLLDEAMAHWRDHELPLHRRLGDARGVAVVQGKIADVLQARGELDEALRIRREEQLPVFEKLGDQRERAVTMGNIADVLQARGELDEALRIRREEQLPVYEKLGDQRSRAVAMGKIADVLQDRGELDEALRIRREEQLPVYEKLGDQRERAVTMSKIADVLQARGELDEALRIRREEQLPVFEKLGDQRSRAVTMGKIADVLQDRGELDEALRIRREEQLPVYEKLGDQRSLLVGRANLALLLLELDGPGQRAEAQSLLKLAFGVATRMGLPEVDQIKAIHRRAFDADL